MKIRKYVCLLIMLLIILLTVTAIFGIHIGKFNIKGANEIRFGIDIRGGVEAVYEPKDLDREPTEQELESARSIIETRLDAKKILDREVTIDKNNGQILVRFPWKTDETNFNPQEAIAELGETAKLTFRDPGGNIILEGKNVKESKVGLDPDNNQPVVTLMFDNDGAKLFKEATEKFINQDIGIYMDETMISSPVVRSVITNGQAIISNMNSQEEAKVLADKINSGALPFSLVSKNHSTISPTNGYGALDVTVKAGVLVYILICLFMILYYKLPGLVACFGLMLQLAIQLLALSIPQVTLTLPGIAGMILSLGMGVDANIIISERIKEELKTGKSLGASIDSGFHRAFSAVFDGNITSMIVAVILMVFGSGTMYSFGYTLLIGTALNFLCGVTVSKYMIKSFSFTKAFRKKSLYGVKEREITI